MEPYEQEIFHEVRLIDGNALIDVATPKGCLFLSELILSLINHDEVDVVLGFDNEGFLTEWRVGTFGGSDLELTCPYTRQAVVALVEPADIFGEMDMALFMADHFSAETLAELYTEWAGLYLELEYYLHFTNVRLPNKRSEI